MSGSYDRFGGRGPGHPPGSGTDAFDMQRSGTPRASAPEPGFADDSFGADDITRPVGRRDVPSIELGPAIPEAGHTPPRRAGDGRKMKITAPVVPPASVTGRSLTLVVAIMCFLASLTAGTVWLIYESSEAWLRDIASEVTVQIEPQDGVDTEKTLANVVGYLVSQPGIRGARPLSLEASSELLEPWLGSTDILKTLPVPRLIAIEIDRNAPPDLAAIGNGLARDFKGASLDDHRRWQQQIRAVTRSFALGGLAILALVAAATTAIIVSATRSAMASNREIVEVLHFVGATDKFIAHEFEKHFLRLGIKAGIVGASLAALVFMGMPAIMSVLGGGTISSVEMQRLIGTGTLDARGYIWLGLVVVTIAGLCMITSRTSVKRMLHERA